MRLDLWLNYSAEQALQHSKHASPAYLSCHMKPRESTRTLRSSETSGETTGGGLGGGVETPPHSPPGPLTRFVQNQLKIFRVLGVHPNYASLQTPAATPTAKPLTSTVHRTIHQD